jgi:lambda repressor-like predicted transcriptional regulator
MKNRQEYKEYFAELQKDALRRARAKIEMRVPEYIDAHKKGLDMALEAHDHRSIPNYTNPILDRVWPRNDQQVAQAAVVIELTPKQLASIDAPAPVVEYEELDDDGEV